MKRVRPLFAAVLALLPAAPAWACTLCHTPSAREVRHWILEHGFAGNLMALAMPLPLLLAAIHLAGREPRRRTPA